jgi:hypothetical protein
MLGNVLQAAWIVEGGLAISDLIGCEKKKIHKR